MAWECRFASHNCAHDALFRPQYQRTNRTQRTKIVRCFPHCCPHHVQRSYCGSSLLLEVNRSHGALHSSDQHQTDATLQHDLHQQHLHVYARFCLETSRALVVGECLPHESIQASVQSEANTTAEWIVASDGHPSKAVNGSTSYLFEINPSARWLYAWDSGATKSQRLTTHVLEAVVFRHIKRMSAVRPSRPDVEEWLEVVASTRSPPFRLTSFRRAVPFPGTEGVSNSEPSLLYQALSRRFFPYHRESTDGHKQFTPSKRSSSDPMMPLKRSCFNHFDGQLPIRQRRESECRMSGEKDSDISRLEFSRDLAIVMTVGERVTLNEMRRREQTDNTSTIRTIAARLVERIYLDSELQIIRSQIVRAAKDDLCQRQRLEDWFGREQICIKRYADNWLAECGVTLHWVASQLKRRLPEDEIHTRDHIYTWRSFVARVRQAVVADTQRRHLAQLARDDCFRTNTRLEPRNASSEWSCRLEEIKTRRWRDGASVPAGSLSSGMGIAFRRQLSHIQLKVMADDGVCTVQIVSLLHQEPSDANVGMLLYLDGRHRTANALPGGDPTTGVALPLMSDWSIGDYAGSTSPSRDSFLDSSRFLVNFYVWPKPANDRYHFALRWRVNMEITHADSRQDLRVTAVLDAGQLSDFSVDLETLRVKEKLRLVQRWEPQLHVTFPYRRVE